MIPHIQDYKHHKFIYTDRLYNLLSAVSVLAANVADKCHGGSQQNMNPSFGICTHRGASNKPVNSRNRHLPKKKRKRKIVN